MFPRGENDDRSPRRLLSVPAQIDPMPVLNSLATELETHGGTLLQGVRAISVSGTAPVRITLRVPTSTEEARQQQLSITSQTCVLATGIPILDRGGFFAHQGSRAQAMTPPGR
jgi:hypothetical protein